MGREGKGRQPAHSSSASPADIVSYEERARLAQPNKVTTHTVSDRERGMFS